MGACVGVFIRERGGVSDSQNTSIGCLILIQSNPSIRNKILMLKIVVDAHSWIVSCPEQLGATSAKS